MTYRQMPSLPQASDCNPPAMRTAIICTSIHHGNTRRIAEAMAGALAARLYTAVEAEGLDFSGYELVGLGSGIYFGRHHSQLRKLVLGWTKVPARSFVFSTAGTPFLWNLWHLSLVRLLRRRGSEVIGQFSCPGFDTFGPLWLIGGLYVGRPNRSDLAHAIAFAQGLGDPGRAQVTAETPSPR